jgi:hypothetical protein
MHYTRNFFTQVPNFISNSHDRSHFKLYDSARRLIGLRLIESAAYYNQILLAQLYINSAQNTWID